MAQPRPAVHRTILVVDVEGFGNHRRTNPHRVAVRDGMYLALRQAFDGAGIPWAGCDQGDGGDGVLVLVPPEVPKGLFVDSLPDELARALRAHNGAHDAEEQIRLRMALHAGEINYDDHGMTGAAINLAFRLLDARPLKTALAASAGVLALIASSWFYDEVVRHAAAGVSASYRRVRVVVKEGSAVGWISLPDHPHLTGEILRSARNGAHPGAEDAWPVRILDAGGTPHGAGVLIGGGRYVLTTARAVARSLGLPVDAPSPAGQVLFDLPVRKEIHVQRAEVVCWRPGQPGGGVAGLSVAGPAIQGIPEPPLWRDGGVALAVGPYGAEETAWMVPIGQIAGEWPLVGAVVAAQEAASRRGTGRNPAGRPPAAVPRLHGLGGARLSGLSRPELMRLVESCLRVPELADAQSRHTIVSELPLAVALTAPRSSAGRADLAALLWSCAQVPEALEKLRTILLGKARDGSCLRELTADLESFQAGPLP